MSTAVVRADADWMWCAAMPVSDAMAAAVGDTLPARGAEPTTRVASDSVALDSAVRRVAATRDSAAAATNAYEAALGALAGGASAMRAGTESGKLSPGLILLGLLISGLGLRFALALSREMRAPRLAHIAEAEAHADAFAMEERRRVHFIQGGALNATSFSASGEMIRCCPPCTCAAPPMVGGRSP